MPPARGVGARRTNVVNYFEVLVVRSKGQVTVGLADAHPASEAPSTSLVNRSRANWMNQPHAVQMLFLQVFSIRHLHRKCIGALISLSVCLLLYY
jgi:hypothetical protein